MVSNLRQNIRKYDINSRAPILRSNHYVAENTLIFTAVIFKNIIMTKGVNFSHTNEVNEWVKKKTESK